MHISCKSQTLQIVRRNNLTYRNCVNSLSRDAEISRSYLRSFETNEIYVFIAYAERLFTLLINETWSIVSMFLQSLSAQILDWWICCREQENILKVGRN